MWNFSVVSARGTLMDPSLAVVTIESVSTEWCNTQRIELVDDVYYHAIHNDEGERLVAPSSTFNFRRMNLRVHSGVSW